MTQPATDTSIDEGRRGRGRPPVGPRITLRFPTDLVVRLDERAEREGTTRSDLLRRGAELVLAEPPAERSAAL